MTAPTATSPGLALKKMRAGRFVRVEELPGSRAAVSSALSRASRRGEVIPVRRGLYFKGFGTRYGMTAPSAEDVALTVIGRHAGVGPTGYSAARALGITTQVPATPALAIPGPIPSGLHGVKLSKRNNRRRRGLRYTEIAALELLRGDWEALVEGGWPALVDAIAAHVDDGAIRLSALAEAVEGERSPRARDNLARLLKDLRTR